MKKLNSTLHAFRTRTGNRLNALPMGGDAPVTVRVEHTLSIAMLLPIGSLPLSSPPRVGKIMFQFVKIGFIQAPTQ